MSGRLPNVTHRYSVCALKQCGMEFSYSVCVSPWPQAVVSRGYWIRLIKSVRSDPIQLLIEQFLLQNWYKMWIHDKYWILETLLRWQCWKKQTHCCWVFWLPCLRHTQCHPEGDPTLFYRMYLLPPSTRAQHTSNAVIVKQWGAVILDVSYHYEIHCKAQAVSLILPCESRGI